MTHLVKDLTYPPPHAVKNPRFCLDLLRRASVDPGTYFRVANLLIQAAEGAQMWVSKDVSDDLQAADLDPEEIRFEEVEWPSNRMEVYFEDPQVPTFLAVNTCDKEHYAALTRLTKLKPEQDVVSEERYISVIAADTEDSVLSFTYETEEVDRFATGSTPDVAPGHSLVSARLEEDEVERFRQLTVLLFKVLLLASSEGHEIRRTREKPTKKQGGKPGFKNRPTTDRLIVEYLPRHHAERRKAAAKEAGKHKFNGRRGHWRRFNSPFFVNKKGTKRFIFPIPGPDGTVPRRKFVVRKPTSAQ